MGLTLSLNTNPLVNRYAEPADLIGTIAHDLKIRDVQLTHEFINPSWPAAVIRRLTRDMRAALTRTGVCITSGMTGPYGRLNHFGHPDADVRRYYVEWFKTFADITADLGGSSVGTQFAIFTYRDFDDAARREELIQIAIDCWAEVAEHAKAAGLSYVFWEPMSIGREFGETIAASFALQDRLTAANMAVPMWMMADIDHGDVTSSNPDDIDPYAWARAAPPVSPIIHIKQSLMDKGGHRPFTAEFNAKGRVQPEPLLAAFAEGGAKDNEICLELSFKEREPNDRQVIEQIAESIAFWAPHIDTGIADLNL
ncbi:MULTISPECIES: sugar phosphate isomerase/epimerase family protein [Rhizobium]|uniref:TIM barrel protein n=1 Tax=Rhizobium rhododendri TaxID=2506430 RepID=A0ABY8ISI1_9HYPH|nr:MULTISPECIES: TIM barrel protein [Rhizobium]MBZ5759375.1 sugar phosphate isomerase/epimerase [Rhizobium sp. VS19-DR96]MBZ5765892.1 sugar phosphate isomerase/epimerase [Rhizobium sp. VS19-DR129.2]MBZ5773976.1 sugar phosphate isomerase/epimerase [Rhizobium sp. VS19-DRK62.2]MBZ5785048.1 sugar phosphate isomerase/epimerase [Rhizobium sp. VS19-DR121]MBZ5801875.1 sugar phosphate isomerase/epimerase [Rhizobium sp. VS19-DR181]